jgi:hypothetical protein
METDAPGGGWIKRLPSGVIPTKAISEVSLNSEERVKHSEERTRRRKRAIATPNDAINFGN